MRLSSRHVPDQITASLTLIVPIALRGHAARDAPRHIPESASLFLNGA